MKTVSNAVGEFLKRPLVSTLATIDEDGSPRTRAIENTLCFDIEVTTNVLE